MAAPDVPAGGEMLVNDGNRDTDPSVSIVEARHLESMGQPTGLRRPGGL
jgi:hypothetical protein